MPTRNRSATESLVQSCLRHNMIFLSRRLAVEPRVRHQQYFGIPATPKITKVGATLIVVVLITGASRLVYSYYSRGGRSSLFFRKPAGVSVLKEQQQFNNDFPSSPFLEIHKGILNKNGQLYAQLQLCRNNNGFPLLDNITNQNDVPSCLSPDAEKIVHKTDNEIKRKWKMCAEQVDPTKLDIQNEVDRLVMFCPHFHHRHRWSLKKRITDKNNVSTAFVLTSPLRTYDPNVYHMIVMRDNKPSHKGRGRDLWCFLDAVTRFGEQQQRVSSSNHNISWRLEYNNQTGYSNYAKELFALLGSTNNLVIEEEEAASNNLGTDGTAVAATTNLSLRFPIPGFKLLERRVPFLQTGPISHSFHFRPNTIPNDALIDISARVVRWVVKESPRQSPLQVVSAETSSSSSSTTVPPSPSVLLILRSGNRKLAGIETGTAAEIVEALLEQSLALRVMDLAEASVLDQILWFSSADVVIGLHGAGLTNLVWMNKHANVTLIEIAASYGWGRYLDSKLDCQRTKGVNLYMKADYYNLAKRFRVHHELVHPVFSSVGLPGNPIVKEVFYVDAKALAALAKRAI